MKYATKIKNNIIDRFFPSISVYAQSIYIIMCRYKNEKGKFPSYREIRKRTGIGGLYTIKKALKELYKFRLIPNLEIETKSVSSVDTGSVSSVDTKKPHKTAIETNPDVQKKLLHLPLYKVDQKFCTRFNTLFSCWKTAYPNLDIMKEIEKAHAWEMSNPRNLKTDRARFINNWLNRVHTKANPVGTAKDSKMPWEEPLYGGKTFDEVLASLQGNEAAINRFILSLPEGERKFKYPYGWTRDGRKRECVD